MNISLYSVLLSIILANQFGVIGVLYSAPAADLGSMVAVVIMSMMVWKELKAAERKEGMAA